MWNAYHSAARIAFCGDAKASVANGQPIPMPAGLSGRCRDIWKRLSSQHRNTVSSTFIRKVHAGTRKIRKSPQASAEVPQTPANVRKSRKGPRPGPRRIALRNPEGCPKEHPPTSASNRQYPRNRGIPQIIARIRKPPQPPQNPQTSAGTRNYPEYPQNARNIPQESAKDNNISLSTGTFPNVSTPSRGGVCVCVWAGASQ